MTEIETGRLVLRRWQQADRESFAALNADPRVMHFFSGTLSKSESDALANRIEAGFEQNGFGLWAVEATGVAPFVGVAGLAVPRFNAHFTPCVEIGWRIASEYWNRGFATEAAQAVLTYAFGALQLDEIVSFTVPGNRQSLRVMEKIGMTHDDADDFEHPSLPEGHPLKRHVLYRITRCDR